MSPLCLVNELLIAGVPLPAHLDDEEDVRVGVGDVEDGRPGERSHATFVKMAVEHVLDIRGVAVQVERLGDLLLLLGIVERHHGKDGLDVQVKPAAEGGREGGLD